MTSVRRALVLSIAERYLLVLLALASNMVVARLLTPEEIGLYAVAFAIVSMSHMLRDFGIGGYLIQQADLQDRHIQTAFGVSLILGTSLFALLFVAAPWIGDFYGDNRVAQVLRIVAWNFLILPFCSISVTLLRRGMRFEGLTIIALSSGLISVAVILGLAWSGAGAMSLALGSVAANVVTGLGAWWLLRDPLVFRPRLSEWKGVFGFGGQSALTNAIVSASENLNDLVLAKVLGFSPTAMLSRAQGLPALFQRELMRALQVVAFPAFAKVHREGGDVEAKWTTAIGSLAVLAWPFYGFVALMAFELIRLMFGHQWDEAVGLVPLFSAAGAVSALAAFVPQMLVAVGRIDLNTRLELLYQPVRALVIVLVVVATRSLEACAWAFLVMAAIKVPWTFAMKQRCSATDWRALGAQLLASGRVTALALAPAVVASLHFGTSRSEPIHVWTFALLCAATVLSWIGAVIWTKHPLSMDPAFRAVMKRFQRRAP